MRQKEAKQEAKHGKSTSDTTPQTLDQPDSTSTSASSAETLSEKFISMDESDEASENRKDGEIIRLKEKKESKSIPKTFPRRPRHRIVKSKVRNDFSEIAQSDLKQYIITDPIPEMVRFLRSYRHDFKDNDFGAKDAKGKTKDDYYWLEHGGRYDWDQSFIGCWLKLAVKDVIAGVKENTYLGGATAMHLAIATNKQELLQVFFSSASLDKPDMNGDSPLMLAFASGDLTATRFLISKGASCKGCNHRGYNLLHLAIMTNNINIISLLNIALNSDDSKQLIDQPDSVGNTPLMVAYDLEDLTAARFLLDKGASATVTNTSKQNLLHRAIIAGFGRCRSALELMQLLFFSIQSKETVVGLISACDIHGKTPMEYCWDHRAYGEELIFLRRRIIQLLLKHGDNPLYKNNQKSSSGINFEQRY